MHACIANPVLNKHIHRILSASRDVCHG